MPNAWVTINWRGSLPNAASDLLMQGVELMLVGMGTVFVFLTLLVLATQAMSSLAIRITGEADTEHPNPEEVAAITAALALHRRPR